MIRHSTVTPLLRCILLVPFADARGRIASGIAGAGGGGGAP
ncbi:MAG TPA: hypothetical protein VK124_05355 [Gemmatimonadales bacterium]|nr:hypothetical protein [Gemmatimonadales bacterium]